MNAEQVPGSRPSIPPPGFASAQPHPAPYAQPHPAPYAQPHPAPYAQPHPAPYAQPASYAQPVANAYAPPQPLAPASSMTESVNGIAYLRPGVGAPQPQPVSTEPTHTVNGMVYLNPHQIGAAQPHVVPALPGATVLLKPELDRLHNKLAALRIGMVLGAAALLAGAFAAINLAGLPGIVAWPTFAVITGLALWSGIRKYEALSQQLTTSNTVTKSGQLTAANGSRHTFWGHRTAEGIVGLVTYRVTGVLVMHHIAASPTGPHASALPFAIGVPAGIAAFWATKLALQNQRFGRRS